MTLQSEYSASEIRRILQQLFPRRRLVLSQFTFFHHSGLMIPTGESYRRGRRCYRLQDVLAIACLLALKGEGIPYKNVESVPAILRCHAGDIFERGPGCRLAGYGTDAVLTFPGESAPNHILDTFLAVDAGFFWSFDVGVLAEQLILVASREASEIRRAA